MIQIDMPMPTNCIDCPACNEYLMCAIPVNGRKWGENDVHDFGQGRPEWCPMKELVRCKDCKRGAWLERTGMTPMVTCGDEDHEPDWFCADGERIVMEYFVEKILPYIVGVVIGGMVIALVYLMFFV